MNSEHRCPVCGRPIEKGKHQTITINPQEITNEQVAAAYEIAKEKEAAAPSSERLRLLYASAGGARLGAYTDRKPSDVPEDEIVTLGRALFDLGAEIYLVHPECLTSPAFEAWFKKKTGAEVNVEGLDKRIERFREDLDKPR